MWGWVVAAPVVSAAGTWLARRYAMRRDLLDAPGERRSHSTPTPRGGGAGPIAAIAMLLVVFRTGDALAGADWRWLLGGLLGVGAIGAWDDHRPLGAGVRLLVHVVAGAAMAAAFGLWDRPLLAIAVAIATTVAINVWNFMDGIDGIASTQAAVVTGASIAFARVDAAGFALGCTLAILAFVPFNFPRARIFLGDVGSGALGYVLVMLAVATSLGGHRSGAWLLLLFPAAAFLVDATLTLGRRMLEGERWWTPHTRHLYQVWARRAGHPRVTLAYGIWSLAGAGFAVWAAGRGSMFIVVSLGVWYTTAAGLWVFMQARSTEWSATA
jgi:UDP-N-acetylmuramyl pentapeptide phosphotransferase/UDP-N-acetylglucosamine-1-phosphate transferase